MSEIVSAISLEFQAGDDLLLRLYVTKDGVAVDMTGMTFVFVAARRIGLDPVISTEDSTPTATVVEGDTGNLIDVAEGSYGIAIAGSVTQDLDGTYEFMSKVIDIPGAVATVSRGYLTFRQGVG